MNGALIRDFWNCGDNQIIEYAVLRARLNTKEKTILEMMLDECMTQEEIAERLDVSTRWVQKCWASAVSKLIGIPWVKAYAYALHDNK